MLIPESILKIFNSKKKLEKIINSDDASSIYIFIGLLKNIVIPLIPIGFNIWCANFLNYTYKRELDETCLDLNFEAVYAYATKNNLSFRDMAIKYADKELISISLNNKL